MSKSTDNLTQSAVDKALKLQDDKITSVREYAEAWEAYYEAMDDLTEARRIVTAQWSKKDLKDMGFPEELPQRKPRPGRKTPPAKKQPAQQKEVTND